MPLASLTLRFIDRDLRNRFAGSFTGGLWALIAPLIQLAVYSFVFVYILPARIPGADAPGYVPFLFAALWPWNALAESLVRSTVAVQENAALIGKIAMPREVLVFASASSSFLVNFAGFVAIVVALALAGKGVHLAGLVPAVALYLALFTLALGLSLALSAMQVFVRDLAQALAQILTILMFCAPIFYDRSLVPERYQRWLELNPFTFYADAFRLALLHHGGVSTTRIAIAVLTAVLALLIGHRIFRRLDPHFEDFL
ncbi:MAG TPA: ABC transporter permease [Rhodanobacteraceae bacterium]